MNGALLARRVAERRGISTCLRGALAVLACAVVLLAGGSVGRAQGLRPADAPRAAAKGSRAPGAGEIGGAGSGGAEAAKVVEPPALPSEYREVDQDGIRFSYHPSTRERIRPLFEKAGAIRASLAAATGADVLRRVEVRVAAVPAEMVQLAPGEVPASAPTVAFFDQRLVVMSVVGPSSSSPLDVESALAHALAHIALDEATDGAALPAWFHEGFALHAEGGDASRTRALVDAAVFGQVWTLDDLSRPSGQGEQERAHAADLVRFLAAAPDRSGHPALPMLLRLSKEGEPFDGALVLSLDASDRATVEARWRADRARRYAFVPVLAALLGIVGLLAGGWVWAARSRRARALVRARRERPPSPARKVVRAPAKVTAAARAAAGRGKDAAIHIPREPEVPKVEHNGEWHTLH